MSKYDFKFGDYWISELGALSTETPGIEIAQRDYELIDIPGKDGADYIDNGRYSNVGFSRSISLIGRRNFPVVDKAATFIHTYAYLQGYQPFEDTDHNDMITEAVLTNFSEINRKLRTLNTATLKFSRKPFWYSKEGLLEQHYAYATINAGVRMTNPFPVDSEPFIRIGFSSLQVSSEIDFDVEINGNKVTVGVLSRPAYENSSVIIDVEKQLIYILNHDTGSKKMLDINIPTGFCLKSGSNIITVTRRRATLTDVYIAPRWRCL